MSRICRNQLVDPEIEGLWHVSSKCCRELRLLEGPDGGSVPDGSCGVEPVGLCKEMLLGRIGFLCGIFCIDVITYSLMGSHMHICARSRPADGHAWTAVEVVERWLLLHPLRNRRGLREPLPGEVEALVSNAAFVEATRRKLMDLSQFMKELKQYVAVEINKLEGCSGPLWAGRFKSKPITETQRGQLLRTMVYIDLNPLAAGLCSLPEEGLHTSLSARLGREFVPEGADGRPTRPASSSWLAPLDGDAQSATAAELVDSAFSPGSTFTRPDRRVVLPGLSLRRYLRLLDHLSRRVREGKASLDAFTASIFHRLGLPPYAGPGSMHAARGAPAG